MDRKWRKEEVRCKMRRWCVERNRARGVETPTTIAWGSRLIETGPSYTTINWPLFFAKISLLFALHGSNCISTSIFLQEIHQIIRPKPSRKNTAKKGSRNQNPVPQNLGLSPQVCMHVIVKTARKTRSCFILLLLSPFPDFLPRLRFDHLLWFFNHWQIDFFR